ncbi:MAG TPA: hypothetical protein VK672_02840 [Solirubrobacteraceae bacterium]|nr:hypothetical protein [Solirubrobacteraceae bacterium]
MRIGHPVNLRTLERALCLALATCGAAAVLAVPAVANTPPAPPRYSLSIVEGANTQPEDSIEHVSASVSSKVEVAVSITHNGLVVAQDKGDGGAWLSQVPQVGDLVTLASAGFTTAVTYDGLPSLEPTVCAGSTTFAGQRTLGYTVEGGYYTVVPHPSYFAHREGGQAQVQVLSGSSFGGNFLKPLVGGETVYAIESLTSLLPGGATFTYESRNDRPVGGCPPPPPPPPPPPLALAGSLVKLVRTSIHKLLHSGWSTHVTINQPGTIVEDLYQHAGFLPAFASRSKHTLKGAPQGAQARKHRRHTPPALLLARGTATSKAAGTVTVTMHLTSAGRRLLKHAHSAKVVLITTLTAGSGAKLALERHFLTLHR